MDKSNNNRFEILSQLAVSAAAGKNVKESAQTALAMAADYVGLNAAALYLWDEDYNINLSVDHFSSKAAKEILVSLERTLFSQLRKESNLSSAYMTFDEDPVFHSFTLPLKISNNKFGAVIGLQQGERTLLSENLFLESLSALLSLSFAAQNLTGSGDINEKINKERTEAIVQTAITINHEINNPLTAILGNIQLLLMDKEKLSDPLINKLEVVEVSALKIKDVVQKLLKLTNPKSVEYANGTNMIDLNNIDEENESKPE